MTDSLELIPCPEGRTPDGRFAPGNSGKPKGARRRLTVAMEAILARAALPMVEQAVALAREGQIGALRLCLDRLSPPRRDAPVEFDLPPIDGAGDVQRASSAILAAIADGELTPTEGKAVMALLVAHKGIVEAGDHERRLAALEAEL